MRRPLCLSPGLSCYLLPVFVPSGSEPVASQPEPKRPLQRLAMVHRAANMPRFEHALFNQLPGRRMHRWHERVPPLRAYLLGHNRRTKRRFGVSSLRVSQQQLP